MCTGKQTLKYINVVNFILLLLKQAILVILVKMNDSCVIYFKLLQISTIKHFRLEFENSSKISTNNNFDVNVCISQNKKKTVYIYSKFWFKLKWYKQIFFFFEILIEYIREYKNLLKLADVSEKLEITIFCVGLIKNDREANFVLIHQNHYKQIN